MQDFYDFDFIFIILYQTHSKYYQRKKDKNDFNTQNSQAVSKKSDSYATDIKAEIF